MGVLGMMSPPVKFTVKSIGASERPVRLRLPFKFGNTAVTETAQVFVKVELESDTGQVSTGYSAQLMVPRWFNKDTRLSNDDTVDELRKTVQETTNRVMHCDRDTIAGIAHQCRSESLASLVPSGTPRLAAGFGSAVVEMAMLDAACRFAGLSIEAAVNADLFGLIAHCPSDLDPCFLAERLKNAQLPDSMFIRHTVGQDATLLEADLRPDAPNDGLPVALETVIARQGIRYFKIKLKGDVEADIAHLVRLSAFLSQHAPGYRATLDANEQFAVNDFADFVDRLQLTPELGTLNEALAFIEQPFAREKALTDNTIPGLLKTLNVPVIIDESDDSDTSLPQALEFGYAGTSVKSCKGVLRAFLNTARIDQARSNGAAAILSAEDLTCQPGICVQQDLSMAGLCGATHTEQNGQYFVAGMQGASPSETAEYLNHHSDLYEPLGSEDATLKIVKGAVSLRSLRDPGFATQVLPDLSNNKNLSI
jgi:L-alanine-DL-glutamate epimerase-like enolase superfamily enzyme